MWIAGLRIVLPDGVLEHGALHIADGCIAAIEDAPPFGATAVIDGRGLTAIPGIIDMHGDMIEQEIAPRPNAQFPIDMAIFELDKRLAASGVTTAYASISFWEPGTAAKKEVRSGERARKAVETLLLLREHLLIDMLVHARYEVTTPVTAPDLRPLVEARKVHLVSLMDHTPGQGQYRNIERYVQSAIAHRKLDEQTVLQEIAFRQQFAKSETNYAIVRDLVELAVARGIPIASHDDDTAEKVAAMAALHVTISEFPVTLEAAQTARKRGMHVVMGAPNVVRGGSHSGNLSARDAVAAGVVDMLAADYSPAALLQSVFILVNQGILPLHEAAKLVGEHPARALGLHDRGAIRIGKLADLVLLEEGPPLRVRATLSRGKPIYWDAAMFRRSMLVNSTPVGTNDVKNNGDQIHLHRG
jgi:alpha-D-ribose 1-methylphosphonate 5-triphosphate diphosphatase